MFGFGKNPNKTHTPLAFEVVVRIVRCFLALGGDVAAERERLLWLMMDGVIKRFVNKKNCLLLGVASC